MKKILSFLLVLSMVLVMCACGEAEGSKRKAAGPAGIELGMTREEVHAILGDPSSTEGQKETYSGVDYSLRPEGFDPDNSMKDPRCSLYITYSNEKVTVIGFIFLESGYEDVSQKYQRLFRDMESYYTNLLGEHDYCVNNSGNGTVDIYEAWEDEDQTLTLVISVIASVSTMELIYTYSLAEK